MIRFVFGALLIIVFLLYSVLFVAYNPDYYATKFKAIGVSTDITNSEESLTEISFYIVSYLGRQLPDIGPSLGDYSNFFNDRERLHMIDVKNLMTIANFLIFGLTMTMYIMIIIQIRSGSLKNLLEGYFIATILIALTILAAYFINFSEAFIVFHKIFFANDLWIMNPSTDRLIMLMPEQFFINMSMRIIKVFVFLFLSSFIVVVFSNYAIKKRYNGNKKSTGRL